MFGLALNWPVTWPHDMRKPELELNVSVHDEAIASTVVVLLCNPSVLAITKLSWNTSVWNDLHEITKCFILPSSENELQICCAFQHQLFSPHLHVRMSHSDCFKLTESIHYRTCDKNYEWWQNTPKRLGSLVVTNHVAWLSHLRSQRPTGFTHCLWLMDD